MSELYEGMPVGFGASEDAVLNRASLSLNISKAAAAVLVAEKLELVRRYDIPAMTRAAAICYWGRSGTLLLGSFLDNHPDILMLPVLTGAPIYPFLDEYEKLPIWGKLVAYPEYSGLMRINEGEFAVTAAPVLAAHYYAAVLALFALYGKEPAAWLNARRRFFQFVHVAYAAGVGRQPGSARPTMIYAQHYVNQTHAERFVEDFPDGQFIHTVRDPISGVDAWFDRQTQLELNDRRHRGDASARFIDPAVATMSVLLTWDCAHLGMGNRSRAIRFEDMHLDTKAIMNRLAAWLDIPYHPCLIESTWNGTPYVVDIRGVLVCGVNPSNAQRRSKNLPLIDRLLVFALFHENFVHWKYPSPRAMRLRWVRLIIIALFWFLPMKMELSTARLIMQGRGLQSAKIRRAALTLRACLFLVKRRLRMMTLIAVQTHSRLSGYERLLKRL